jgi:5-(carboxyamino)imidazole ribonucleotide synthase
VTYEWEGVPASSAELLIALGHDVQPGVASLETSQDRVTEKQLFGRLGIPTAPWRPVDTRADLDAAIGELGCPAILKTRRGGYDGKGQVRIASSTDADAAWSELGGVPLVLEGFVAFRRELSVLAVRGRDGTTAVWPLVDNTHRDGILRLSVAPAPGLDPVTAQQGTHIATAVLDALGHIGVICIELFDTDAGLVANEFAPRVHNSGHWTIEGAATSQFENHVRAVLGLPLGATDATGHSAMLNAIGELPDRAAALGVAGAHFHDYAKPPRAGRKVGHVTVTAASESARDARLDALRRALGG